MVSRVAARHKTDQLGQENLLKRAQLLGSRFQLSYSFFDAGWAACPAPAVYPYPLHVLCLRSRARTSAATCSHDTASTVPSSSSWLRRCTSSSHARSTSGSAGATSSNGNSSRHSLSAGASAWISASISVTVRALTALHQLPGSNDRHQMLA